MDTEARDKAVYLAKLAEQAERYDGTSVSGGGWTVTDDRSASAHYPQCAIADRASLGGWEQDAERVASAEDCCLDWLRVAHVGGWVAWRGVSAVQPRRWTLRVDQGVGGAPCGSGPVRAGGALAGFGLPLVAPGGCGHV